VVDSDNYEIIVLNIKHSRDVIKVVNDRNGNLWTVGSDNRINILDYDIFMGELRNNARRVTYKTMSIFNRRKIKEFTELVVN
jgi:hypothetical protein